MKRGSKNSIYAKKITSREEKLFKQLARTGISDKSQSKMFCNLGEERLQKLQNSGYIKLSNRCVEGKNTTIIQLNDKGKKYCKENLEIKSFASAQTNHLTHDLRLATTYYTLPEPIQDTWTHERDLIKEVYDRHPSMKGQLKTCIDARVQVGGQYVAIEVVGASYGQAEINMKESIALQYLQCESIEFI